MQFKQIMLSLAVGGMVLAPIPMNAGPSIWDARGQEIKEKITGADLLGRIQDRSSTAALNVMLGTVAGYFGGDSRNAMIVNGLGMFAANFIGGLLMPQSRDADLSDGSDAWAKWIGLTKRNDAEAASVIAVVICAVVLSNAHNIFVSKPAKTEDEDGTVTVHDNKSNVIPRRFAAAFRALITVMSALNGNSDYMHSLPLVGKMTKGLGNALNGEKSEDLKARIGVLEEELKTFRTASSRCGNSEK